MKQVPVSRREQNKVRTRGAILKAARTQFSETGIAGTTMDEIANLADVSRATLFNYFPSKADIVAELAAQMDDAVIPLIRRYASEPGPLVKKIAGVFSDTGHYLETHREILRHLVGISEQSWGDRSGIARIARLTDAFVELLDQANMRPDVDTRVAAEVLVSIYIGFIHNWRMSEHYPLERRLSIAARLVADALAPSDTNRRKRTLPGPSK